MKKHIFDRILRVNMSYQAKSEKNPEEWRNFIDLMSKMINSAYVLELTQEELLTLVRLSFRIMITMDWAEKYGV